MEAVAIRTVSPNQAKKSIHRAFKKQRPLFIWGPPGIGKSDIIHQIGNEIEALVIDVRLWESRHCKGILLWPNDNKMVWAPSQNFQMRRLPT